MIPSTLTDPELLLAARGLVFHLSPSDESYHLSANASHSGWTVARHYRAGYDARIHCNLALEGHLVRDGKQLKWQPLQTRGNATNGCILGYDNAVFVWTDYGQDLLKNRHTTFVQQSFDLPEILVFINQWALGHGKELRPGYATQN